MNAIAMLSVDDIPQEFIGTPVEKLIRYHNFGEKSDNYTHPEILVAKCMDFRVQLNLPARFAYKLRTGGCNLRHNDFQVAFAVAVGGVTAIALIGHNDCGMVSLENKREPFVIGFMAQSGKPRPEAEAFFDRYAPENSLCKETDILFEQAHRYRSWFPNLTIATLLFCVDDGLLYNLPEPRS